MVDSLNCGLNADDQKKMPRHQTIIWRDIEEASPETCFLAISCYLWFYWEHPLHPPGLKPVMKLVELDSFFHIFDWVGALVFQPPFPTGFAMALPLGRRLLPRLLPRHDPLRCGSYRSLSIAALTGSTPMEKRGGRQKCWREPHDGDQTMGVFDTT